MNGFGLERGALRFATFLTCKLPQVLIWVFR